MGHADWGGGQQGGAGGAPQGNYTVQATCSNCGKDVLVLIPKGTLIGGKECPNCGCYGLKPKFTL